MERVRDRGPAPKFHVVDVAALILNKMVGTGIYTTPGAVLAYIKSKSVSLALWAVGGIWTGLILLTYLEFGSALPFNGGELIYLDEVYPSPELLATILFSGFFLILGNSYGNAVVFAKHVLLAAEPSIGISTELDQRLVRLIAITILSVVCLLHYFSDAFGRFLNKTIALFKVAGEIRHSGDLKTPFRTLKLGAAITVIVVWVLYVLVTLAYYVALDYATIVNGQSDLGVALFFAPKVFGQSLGLKICIALSAFGNLLAVTYTYSKVKQAIAYQQILPFYKFFQKDENTPKGGLVLHWMTTVLLISICPTTADGYSFAVGIFTYAHFIVSTFVVIGLWRLPKRMQEEWPHWKPEIFTSRFLVWGLPTVLAMGNILVLIWGAKPHDPGHIPRYWYPLIFVFVMMGSFLYWSGMRAPQIELPGNAAEGEQQKKTLGEMIGFEVKIYDDSRGTFPADMTKEMVQSRMDGSRRRVVYKTSGVFATIGEWNHKVRDFAAKWLF